MRTATLGRATCLVAALAAMTGCVPPPSERGVSWGPGTRIRVSTPSAGGDGLVGSLVGLVGDTLTLLPAKRSDTTVVVILSDRTRLERSMGRHTHALKGAGIGLLVGATGGAIAGHVSGDDKGGWFGYTASDKAHIGAVTFGIAGALVGLAIGGNLQTEEWQLVRLSPGGRIGVVPRSDARVALAYSFAF